MNCPFLSPLIYSSSSYLRTDIEYNGCLNLNPFGKLLNKEALSIVDCVFQDVTQRHV
jgi:hypothetical protein